MNLHKLPNFLIVGAAKSGTTSLFYYLEQHPDIFVPRVKEPLFFCEPQGTFVRTKDEYLALFKDRENERASGEASVAYLLDENSAYKIKDFLGEIKIIILLRNPADRAFSQWSFFNFRDYDTLSFEEALDIEEARIKSPEFRQTCHGHPGYYYYFNSGLYYEQVKRYIDIFGKENVQVHIFEEFVKNPLIVCQQIFDLLDIDSEFQPHFEVHNYQQQVKNGMLNRFISTNRPKWLEKMWFRLPMNIRLQAFRVLKIIYWSNMDKAPSRHLDQDLRNQLLTRFLDDILLLENMLERDLSIWYGHLDDLPENIKPSTSA